jgi:rubrerythrin
VAAYEKARQVELDSEKFYREKADEVDRPYAKELLHRIADEEKKHAHLLENIIEFIAKPDTYLENAEFGKLDEF